MERNLKFLKTMSVAEFKAQHNVENIEVKRNEHTGKCFFVYGFETGACSKKVETGELTSVIVYAIQILMSLNMVTFVFVMIMIAGASTDRITEVFNEVPEMQDKADAVKEVRNGEITCRFQLCG